MDNKIQHLANLIYLQKQKFDCVEIEKALNVLLENTEVLEIIQTCEFNNETSISSEKFQVILSSLNEKTIKRKDNGVYYTSSDVSRYIIINSMLNRYVGQKSVSSFDEGFKKILSLSQEEITDLIFKMKIIDPTCGSGEFIITSFNIKNELCNSKSDEDVLKIAKTIFGNDIDEISVLICKIRLFFHICEKLEKKTSYLKLAKILSNQFYCVDFVANHTEIKSKFDLAIGNPPYVEYSKYSDPSLLKNKFGNIYADVLMNSFDILKKDGVIGYIIPISYSSTPRMSKIRDYINEQTELQFILSFADRPDCLFNGVHQKLNIVIAKRGSNQRGIYTSNYQYWYKQERENLFDNISVIENNYNQSDFIPKIGNSIEQSICNKIFSFGRTNISSFIEESEHCVHLNMRACFWVKAFTFNPGSKEYKKFSFSKEYKNFVMCVLNSSLFWFFWVVVSDCWHITTKDLNNYFIPTISDFDNYDKLSTELQNKLEETKKYIGSKQTEYEYKHRLCKDVIDKIDDEISSIYNLTTEELEYVKNFALKYRKGDGSIG